MPELHVEGLRVAFPGAGGPLEVVRDFALHMGAERVGLVGESGSGKSTVARAILGLVPRPGQVRAQRLQWDGVDLLRQSAPGWRALRGKRMAMVLQDPRYSLNPMLPVGQQIAEAALLHGVFPRAQARQQVLQILAEVGVERPEQLYHAYAHQLSGGLGQRVMIAAMVLAAPDLLIADEPTSALDVLVRRQVLEVLDRAVRKRAMGLLLISHDLPMVARFCDRVLVLYRGQLVEQCAASALFASTHPYTRALLDCLPQRQPRGQRLPTLDRTLLPATLRDAP